MEFGIGMFGDLSFNLQDNTYQKASERLSEIVEQVRFADELAIDAFAMGEHHREDYAVPSPEIILSALATTTQTIKLMSGVSVVSSTDPVKLFQDFTLLDLLSGNRAEIMAGRGSFIESFPLFGYDLNDYPALFEEKLNLLLQLREHETINWQGKFRAPIVSQTIFPRPERKIPVSIAVGGTPESVQRAAKLGLPIVFAIIGGSPEQFIPLINYYKAEYLRYGHAPEHMKIGVHSHTFIAESKDAVLKNYFPCYAHSMNKIGRERGWRSSYSPESFKAGMGRDGALFMGSPEEVTEKLIRTIEVLGIQQFIAHIDVGGPSHKEQMHTIEMLGTKVLPLVKQHFNTRG